MKQNCKRILIKEKERERETVVLDAISLKQFNVVICIVYFILDLIQKQFLKLSKVVQKYSCIKNLYNCIYVRATT